MPHLQYCGSYFRVSSDELWLPGFCSTFIRVWWTLLLCIVTIAYSSVAKHCEHDIVLVFLYLTISIGMSITAIGLEVVVMYYSVQGTLIDTYIRDVKLPRYLNWRLALGMAQLPTCLFGFATVYRYGYHEVDRSCKDTQLMELIVLGVVALFQFFDTTAIVCCCYIFSAKPNLSSNSISADQSIDVSATWSSRCKTMCKGIQLCTCNLFGGSHLGNEFDAIGKVLTALFHHDGFLDVVASDVIAGIILMRIEQQQQQQLQHQYQHHDHRAASPGISMDTVSAMPSFSPFVDVEIQNSVSSNSNNSFSGFNKSTTAYRYKREASSALHPDEEEAEPEQYERYTSFDYNIRYPKLVPHRYRRLQQSFSHDRVILKDLAHYSAFATAIYSHLLAMYMYPVSAPCGICVYKTKMFGQRKLHMAACCCCFKGHGGDHVLSSSRSSAAASSFQYRKRKSLRSGINNYIGLLDKEEDKDSLDEGDFEGGDNTIELQFLPERERGIASSNITARDIEQGRHDNNPSIDSSNNNNDSNKFDRDDYNDLSPNNISDVDMKCVLEGDNCIGLNEAGLLFLAKSRPNCELMFASFTNNLKAKPYAIFRDHVRKEIVVVVRGTLSLEDCITDVICASEEMTAAGNKWGFNGSGRYAHSGMLRAAMHIRQEIDDNRILQSFGHEKNLRLVVVGHSLGAGTAVLLAMMLRPTYSRTVCYAYGVPGSVLDVESAKECASYVISCVLGYDIICRLNLQALVRLRENVLDCITRAKVSKLRIMQSVFKDASTTPVFAYMYDKDRIPDTPLRRSVVRYTEEARRRVAALGHEELAIPGTIIHLQQNTYTTSSSSKATAGSTPSSSSSMYDMFDSTVASKSAKVVIGTSSSTAATATAPPKAPNCCRCCGNETICKVLTPVISEPHRFRDIVLDPSMAWEHFPDRYFNELHKLAKLWEIDDDL